MKHILLTISLILGASAAGAEIKAGEILGTGKVISQFDQPSKRNGKLILIHNELTAGCRLLLNPHF